MLKWPGRHFKQKQAVKQARYSATLIILAERRVLTTSKTPGWTGSKPNDGSVPHLHSYGKTTHPPPPPSIHAMSYSATGLPQRGVITIMHPAHRWGKTIRANLRRVITYPTHMLHICANTLPVLEHFHFPSPDIVGALIRCPSWGNPAWFSSVSRRRPGIDLYSVPVLLLLSPVSGN